MGTRSLPYITGHYAPTADELTAFEPTVHGTLPPELTGRYFRIEHNPKPVVTPTLPLRVPAGSRGQCIQDQG
ncbi:hypothetical protein ACFWF7_04800 [Nocardia sp. NPDC060256]|uniref:hypothetical protein n=1 Tax=unclassified Nocardia TaxID=2637762 RepID=UPI0036511885